MIELLKNRMISLSKPISYKICFALFVLVKSELCVCSSKNRPITQMFSRNVEHVFFTYSKEFVDAAMSLKGS